MALRRAGESDDSPRSRIPASALSVTHLQSSFRIRNGHILEACPLLIERSGGDNARMFRDIGVVHKRADKGGYIMQDGESLPMVSLRLSKLLTADRLARLTSLLHASLVSLSFTCSVTAILILFLPVFSSPSSIVFISNRTAAVSSCIAASSPFLHLVLALKTPLRPTDAKQRKAWKNFPHL